jgi:hypothetical protein
MGSVPSDGRRLRNRPACTPQGRPAPRRDEAQRRRRRSGRFTPVSRGYQLGRRADGVGRSYLVMVVDHAKRIHRIPWAFRCRIVYKDT